MTLPPQVHALAVRLAGPGCDPADLASEAVLALLTHAPVIAAARDPAALGYTVARRAMLTYRRKQLRHRSARLPASLPGREPEPMDALIGAEAVAVARFRSVARPGEVLGRAGAAV